MDSWVTWSRYISFVRSINSNGIEIESFYLKKKKGYKKVSFGAD
jgi:hypothetical protein